MTKNYKNLKNRNNNIRNQISEKKVASLLYIRSSVDHYNGRVIFVFNDVNYCIQKTIMSDTVCSQLPILYLVYLYI